MYQILKEKMDELLIKAKEAGLNVGFYCGTRTYEEQAELYAKGRDINGHIIDITKIVTYARPGFSWHCYGLAFDLVFLINGEWNWANNNEWEKLGLMGESLGLEWGGRFENLVDRPHFQLTNGVSITEAKIIFNEPHNYEAVWKLIENKRQITYKREQDGIVIEDAA